MKKSILVVDDELNMRKVLEILFKREGCRVTTSSNGIEALEIIKSGRKFDLILSDLKMPEMDGIELLEQIRGNNIDIPVILLTAYGTIAEAVSAIKLGAADFITKPFNKDDLLRIVGRELENKSGKERRSRIYSDSFTNDAGVIFAGEKMSRIMEMVRKIAPSNLPILLTGESGTGKGVIAKAIHKYAFPDSERPFVSINCPAIPESLLESELFGYKKGAFTGALTDFPGKISMADGGTLFLDEIGDLSLNIQAKLLRLLEEGIYEQLGSTEIKRAQIRIISATNQPLETMIEEKKFREDLYYRINSVEISIPSLRERRTDIIPFAYYFLEKFSGETSSSVKKINREGMDILLSYPWPGNVRELRNVIHRAVILSEGEFLDISAFPGSSSQNGLSSISEVEKNYLVKALEKNSWNISAAARELGMSRGSLRHRIKKYNLSVD